MILRLMQAVTVMGTVNLGLRSGNVENISSTNVIFLALSDGWKGSFDFTSPTPIWKTVAIVYLSLRLANSSNLLATNVEVPTRVLLRPTPRAYPPRLRDSRRTLGYQNECRSTFEATSTSRTINSIILAVAIGYMKQRAKPLWYAGEWLSLRVMKTGLNNRVNKTHIVI